MPCYLVTLLPSYPVTFLPFHPVTLLPCYLVRRIRPLISQSTAVLVYISLIQPHFDYCSLVWAGLSDQLSDKLQKLQNRVARGNFKGQLWN